MSGNNENLGDYLISHVANGKHWKSPLWEIDLSPYRLKIFNVDFGLSLDVIMLGLAFVLCLVLLIPAARRRNLVPINRFAHGVEAIVLYLRDEVVKPFVGEKQSAAWTPFALTLFFFILSLNLIGLIPYMHAATGNISVTGSLALMIFVLINLFGVVHNGVIHYLKGIAPGGIPLPLLLFMYPIEVVSLVAKSGTLAVRLFANMAAGHFLIFSLLGLMAIMKTYLWAGFSLPMSVAMYGFEVFVAFLQAYVFTLLSMLFIGSAIHQDH
jgi:F-type H+-transporting ATPase subunit a